MLSQIRLATPLAPRSVGVKAADLKPYSERNAVAVVLQVARGSAKAFEQERGCKSTRLQQRRQADGPRQGARADDGGTVALCLPTPRLYTQVSLLARPRPRSVLLCVPAPCLSSTAQPDHRLHSVGGRRLSDAALEPTFDGCPAAASGSSMAARRSSRRRPRCHRGVHQWPERAAFDVRTAVGRRVCRPPPAGRSARTHCRAVWLIESLDVFWSVCNVKRQKRVHPGLDPSDYLRLLRLI